MLLRTLTASIIGNALAGKGAIKACESTIIAGENFQCRPILWLILKDKNIIKMNLNLMVFIQEIIYLN